MVICVLIDLLSGLQICRLSIFWFCFSDFQVFNCAFIFSGFQAFRNTVTALHIATLAKLMQALGQALLMCTKVDVNSGSAFVFTPFSVSLLKPGFSHHPARNLLSACWASGLQVFRNIVMALHIATLAKLMQALGETVLMWLNVDAIVASTFVLTPSSVSL
jgi:hypothetical protein